MGAKKKTSVGLLVFNPLCMVKAKRNEEANAIASYFRKLKIDQNGFLCISADGLWKGADI